jgi:acyl-CoA thioesterase
MSELRDAPAIDAVTRVVDHMLANDAFTSWLGAEVVQVGIGLCTLRMTVRAEMVNGFGVAHGGIAYSFADSAMAFACNSAGRVTVALDTSMSYPAAVQVGDQLIAVAEEESATSRLAFYRVTVRRADDTIVGLFRGTVYRTQRMHDLDSPEAGS